MSKTLACWSESFIPTESIISVVLGSSLRLWPVDGEPYWHQHIQDFARPFCLTPTIGSSFGNRPGIVPFGSPRALTMPSLTSSSILMNVVLKPGQMEWLNWKIYPTWITGASYVPHVLGLKRRHSSGLLTPSNRPYEIRQSITGIRSRDLIVSIVWYFRKLWRKCNSIVEDNLSICHALKWAYLSFTSANSLLCLITVVIWKCLNQFFNEQSGPRLNIKTVLSTYGDFHVKDKTAVRTSYL